MTEDVGVLRRARPRGGRAARRARGRERAGRDPGRAGDGPAGARHRLLARDARAGARRTRPRRGSSSCSRRRHARPRARRAGGAHLLPVPRAPPPADLGRPRRTFERVAASLRPGGRFAWNAFAFDHQIAARLDGVHQDEPVPHTSGTPSATTASTSCSTTAARARCGGRRRTSGSACSTSPGSSSRRCTAASTGEPFDDESREYVFVTRLVPPSPLAPPDRVGLLVVRLVLEEEIHARISRRRRRGASRTRRAGSPPAGRFLPSGGVLLPPGRSLDALELDNTCKCHVVPPHRCPRTVSREPTTLRPSRSIERWCCSGSPPHRPSPCPPRSNVETAVRLISAAAADGAAVVVFPELFLCCYDLESIAREPERCDVAEDDPRLDPVPSRPAAPAR